MFKSRFFWKLYVSYALLVLVTAAGIAILALTQTEAALLQEKEVRLRHQCMSMAPEAARYLRGDVSGDDGVSGDLVHRLAGGDETRVTFIAADGTVVADTHELPERMDNHIDRPEVQEALVAGFGVATRGSRTVNERMFYVAHVPAREAGTPIGYVRLSLSIADIDHEIGAMRFRFIVATAFGLLAALGLGAFLAHRLTRPMAEVTRAAESLIAGRFDTRLKNLPNDEIGILGDALDRLGVEITERISDLSGKESRLRAMLAGMVEGVVAVDDVDRVDFSNHAAHVLLGIEDLDGERLWEKVRVTGLDALLREAREHNAVAQCELVCANLAGREVVLRAQAHRYLVEGRAGVVVVLEDITELRRLERVRRDFVANVSHELKTPLTTIRGFVETLLDGTVDDPATAQRFLAKVESNVGRLEHLVADLLSLARIEEQRGELPVTRVDVIPLIKQSLRFHDAAATNKGIRCELKSVDGPVYVMGDRESLVQIVDNLLNNAIKYTLDGGSVTVATSTASEAPNTVVLTVTDTGIGIPAADLERIFERFYRVDKARSRAVGGTGLGLSIVKHLASAMGGSVGVESDAESGTTFSVRLPASS